MSKAESGSFSIALEYSYRRNGSRNAGSEYAGMVRQGKKGLVKSRLTVTQAR
jgi:hypothetical protein